MNVQLIQMFAEKCDFLTEEQQKAIKGGHGHGRRRRRGHNRDEGDDNNNSEDYDPGCPPDYDE